MPSKVIVAGSGIAAGCRNDKFASVCRIVFGPDEPFTRPVEPTPTPCWVHETTPLELKQAAGSAAVYGNTYGMPFSNAYGDVNGGITTPESYVGHPREVRLERGARLTLELTRPLVLR